MDSYLKYFHLLCVLLLCIATCGQCRILRQIDEPTPVTESIHSFANDLYQLLERSEGNVVVSPLSLFTSMSMASLGAKGVTLEEIQRTLRLSPEALNRMGGIISSFQDVEEFDMANFLWVPRGVLLRAEYAREMYDTFQTRVRDADFKRSELVRSLINRLIGNVTHDKIQEFLPTGAVSADTKVLMANAVYFKGEWFHPFDEANTKPMPFFTSDDQSINVPMMNLKETFRGGVFDELDSKAIFMGYKDNRFGLLLVLPNRYDGLNELESKLNVNNYTASYFMRKMIHRDVDVTLPRFRIQYGLEMANIFKQMGITELFGPHADLTRMSGSPLAESMKVSSIFHRATLEINEGGSEASAASGLEIIPLIGPAEGQSGPIDFRADHPFMFYLIDRDSENLPVFIGRVTNPLDDSEPKSMTISLKEAEAPAVDSDSDRVIYPEAASRSIHFPDTKDADEEPSISRPTRDSGSETDSDVVPLVPTDTKKPESETPDLILRVKDKNWFKKPTAAEVIIPESAEAATTEAAPVTTTRTTRRPVTTRRRAVNRGPTPNRGLFNFQAVKPPSSKPSPVDGSAFSFEASEEEEYPNNGNTWNRGTLPSSGPGDNGLFTGLFGPPSGSWPESGFAFNAPPPPGFGPDSGVLFPNLRIVSKQIGDGISGIITTLTSSATKSLKSK